MTILAKLLTQKQQLIDRLRENPGSREHEEIELLMEKINTGLYFLDEARPGTSERDER